MASWRHPCSSYCRMAALSPAAWSGSRSPATNLRARSEARRLSSLVLEIDRRAPFRVIGDLAAHDREIFLLERAGELARLTVADGLPVDREDRLDLVAGAAEEGLLGGIELGAVDLSLCWLAMQDENPRGKLP